jgi:hypothetical protein
MICYAQQMISNIRRRLRITSMDAQAKIILSSLLSHAHINFSKANVSMMVEGTVTIVLTMPSP